MKKALALIIVACMPIVLTAQEALTPLKQKANDAPIQAKNDTVVKEEKRVKSTHYGWNKRISFFVGAGVTHVTNDIYALPIIDKTNNHVIIERDGNTRPNISTGIVYTPRVYNIYRYVDYIENGKVVKDTLIEHMPKHFSVALFINPASMTNAGSGLSSTVDVGFGLGWRSDNFSAFATCEFFGLKQPRAYFVANYQGNDTPYVVGGEIQTAIDVNDNSIFKNQVMMGVGIKLAYTFDIVSQFASEEE